MKYAFLAPHFDKALEWGLYSVVFFLPISMAIVTKMMLFCTGVWILRAVVLRNFSVVRSSLDLPIWFFVGVGILSVLGSPDREFSTYNFGYLMTHYVLAYYLIINTVTSFEQVKRLFQILFISATGTAFYGIYQYIYGVDISQFRWVDGDQFPELRVRMFSSMENPNIYAGYLVTVISLAIGMMLATVQKKMKYVYAGLITLLCVCLALTYSRGSWISFLGVIAALGLIRNRRFLWLLILAPLLAVWINPVLLERLTSIANPVDSSSALRIALWESSLAMLLDHPWVGIGWGAYWIVYPTYDFFINNSNTTIFHAHNMFLHIGAELGFLGLAAFLWIMSAVLLKTYYLYRQCHQAEICGVTLGLAAAFIGIIVNGLTDYVMFNIQMSILFWVLIGLAVSTARFTEKSRHTTGRGFVRNHGT